MSSDGEWVVTLVHLTATGNGRDGDWLRVTHRRFFIGEARDWDGVARLGVDVSDLREVLGLEACTAGICCAPGNRDVRLGNGAQRWLRNG